MYSQDKNTPFGRFFYVFSSLFSIFTQFSQIASVQRDYISIPWEGDS